MEIRLKKVFCGRRAHPIHEKSFSKNRIMLGTITITTKGSARRERITLRMDTIMLYCIKIFCNYKLMNQSYMLCKGIREMEILCPTLFVRKFFYITHMKIKMICN